MPIPELLIIAVGLLALYGVLWLSFTDPHSPTTQERAAKITTDRLIRRSREIDAQRQHARQQAELQAALDCLPTTCPQCHGERREGAPCPMCDDYGSEAVARTVRGLDNRPPLHLPDDIERLMNEVNERRLARRGRS